MRVFEELSHGSLPRPKIQVIQTKVLGCYELRPSVVNDGRGFFAKIFHRPLWNELGLCTEFHEEYITHSHPGALRGIHFQVPPYQQDKVVLCLRGKAWDVGLDLRIDSPTYLEHAVVNLDSTTVNAMYLPAGVAHGFCATDEAALMYYKASSVYSPLHDQGIRWDSAHISWPVNDPIISERDRGLPRLDEFSTPFKLNALAGE